jgi:hypothetical protein
LNDRCAKSSSPNLVEDLLRRFRVPVDFKMTHTPQPSASRGAAHKKKRRD